MIGSLRVVAISVVLLCMLSAPVSAAAGELPHVPARSAYITAGAVLYDQPLIAGGNWYQSSVNGTDYDKIVWDNFTLPTGQSSTITEVRWRGAYIPGTPSSGVDFVVAIYPSVPGVFQPDRLAGPLVTYPTNGNAGETEAGPSGTLAKTYEYHFTLPQPFQPVGGTTYWIYIVAAQTGIPNWYLLQGSGGEGWHWVRQAGAGDWQDLKMAGDIAFTLTGPGTGGPTIFLPLIVR